MPFFRIFRINTTDMFGWCYFYILDKTAPEEKDIRCLRSITSVNFVFM